MKPTGDAPLEILSQDEFGLSPIVQSLSSILAERISASGYTLGIEGSWGSGKSTLANFVANDLKRITHHHVLRFEPWLIGEKHALLTSFLGQLASKLDEIEQEGVGWLQVNRWGRIRTRSKASILVRRYGQHIGALAAPLGSAAKLDTTGMTLAAAASLKLFGWLSQLFGKQPSLEQLKSQIAAGLTEIEDSHPGTRITVFIDDTDRLEASEAIELLRLVRKVVDLPMITYVICFDGSILEKQVKSALNIDDGRLFVEKIFQDVIHIPPQEPFALRRYLKRLLIQSFGIEMMGNKDDQELQYRKDVLFDRWCGRFITTPRDVVRLHQAVALGWPCVPAGSDFFDFVWLQLLKLKSADLYKWTREYLQNIGSYRDGGRPGDTEPSSEAVKLLDILKRLHWDDRLYLSGLDQFLPGLRPLLSESEKQKVFEFEDGELESNENSSRLGSPSHWRNYFAFDVPSYAVRDSEISAFREAVALNHSKAAELLMAALERPHDRTGHFLDVLLDRLLDQKQNTLSEKERSGMLSAFAETMDNIERKMGQVKTLGESEIWDKTKKLLRHNPPANFLTAVKRGKSINWLAEILRDQGFALGLPAGHRAYPEHQWLTREAFEECVNAMTSRFESIGLKKIFSMPAPLDILFCWSQLGSSEQVKLRFAEATARDSDFVTGLAALCGWSSSSATGISHPLYEEYVVFFADPNETLERLKSLSSNRQLRGPLRKRANELLRLWRPAQSRR